MSGKGERRVPQLRFSGFEGDWSIVTFQEAALCDLIDCEHKTAPYTNKQDYFVVRTNNVKGGQLLYDDIKYTTEKGFKEWTRRGVPKFGDILFTREAPAGESCLVPDGKKVCLGQRMVLLKPDLAKISGQYLSSYLQSNKAVRRIFNLSIGTTVTRINIADIYKIKCPITSLLEQQKIASFLSSVDKKIKQLTRKKELLEQYKKWVMQKIFSQEIRFKDQNGQDFPDWKKKSLGELCIGIKSGKTKSNEYGSYPVYGSTGQIGFCDQWSHSGKYILVARVGANAGSIYCVGGKFGVTDNTIFLEVGKDTTPGYLYQLLRNYNLKRLVFGTGQPLVTGGQIKSLKFSLPTLQEQNKIADFLTAIDQKINSVNAQLTATQSFKKGLLQNMFV